MNWLDNYILKHKTGYYISDDGGLFVDAGNDYVRCANGRGTPVNLDDITRDQFIVYLLKGVE